MQIPSRNQIRHSNTDIDIAAACLEVAAQTPFEEFLQKNIFDPLDMKDTTFTPNPDMISRLAKSYTSDQAPFRPATDAYSNQLILPNDHQVYPAACAGLFSIPRDMIAFSQMLAYHGDF